MALLNLTNFDDHPTEPHWMVFRFGDRIMADEFIEGLKIEEIPYEAELEDGPHYLIGVKQRFRKAAIRVNYVVLGRHRKPFISDGYLRWSVLVLFLILFLLALAGWWRST